MIDTGLPAAIDDLFGEASEIGASPNTYDLLKEGTERGLCRPKKNGAMRIWKPASEQVVTLLETEIPVIGTLYPVFERIPEER